MKKLSIQIALAVVTLAATLYIVSFVLAARTHHAEHVAEQRAKLFDDMNKHDKGQIDIEENLDSLFSTAADDDTPAAHKQHADEILEQIDELEDVRSEIDSLAPAVMGESPADIANINSPACVAASE